MSNRTDYAQRAKAAHASAEAATDPRDKAAWRGAARTWERLANPGESAFSLEPLRRELAALRADLDKPLEPSDAPQAPRSAPAPTVERTAQPVRQMATIEF